MLKLNNTIKIMVPTQDNDGEAIDYMSLIQGVTKLVGGSTVYDAQGLWISNDKLYKDTNKLVEFNMDDVTAYETLTEVIGNIAGPLLHEGGQMAVWLQVNGVTFILNHATVDEFVEIVKTLHWKLQ